MKNFMYLIVIGLLYISSASIAQRMTKATNDIELSSRDVNYLFNRALDLTLKSKRSTISLVGVFYLDNTDQIKNIYISIDPILYRDVFMSRDIPEIDKLTFDSIKLFDLSHSVSFVNTVDCKFIHYDVIPKLDGNHLTHVRFSPIFQLRNRIFIGVQVINQISTTTGIENDYSYVIYEAEKCKNGVVCFRRMFVPIGFRMDGGKSYIVHEMDDRPCEFPK
jgi:hypothetical protein